MYGTERKQETMRYLEIEVKVVENGYFVTVSYAMPDDTHVYTEHVFNSRADLYAFLDPLLLPESDTAKSGDDDEEWNNA